MAYSVKKKEVDAYFLGKGHHCLEKSILPGEYCLNTTLQSPLLVFVIRKSEYTLLEIVFGSTSFTMKYGQGYTEVHLLV
jgi:hypothetical protein